MEVSAAVSSGVRTYVHMYVVVLSLIECTYTYLSAHMYDGKYHNWAGNT